MKYLVFLILITAQIRLYSENAVIPVSGIKSAMEQYKKINNAVFSLVPKDKTVNSDNLKLSIVDENDRVVEEIRLGEYFELTKEICSVLDKYLDAKFKLKTNQPKGTMSLEMSIRKPPVVYANGIGEVSFIDLFSEMKSVISDDKTLEKMKVDLELGSIGNYSISFYVGNKLAKTINVVNANLIKIGYQKDFYENGKIVVTKDLTSR